MKRRMKQRTTAFMALAMTVSLAGCGGGEAPAPAASSAASSVAEQPVVVANELDQQTPIPAYSGSLALSEQVFSAQQLGVSVTADMAVSEEDGAVYVKPADGVWTIMFQPYGNHEKTNLINHLTNYYTSAGLEVFPDRSEAETTFMGFATSVYARNIDEQYYLPEEEQYIPSVNLLMDYGTTLVGEWAGMRVRLTTDDYEGHANIYEVLAREDVRAVLNSFRIIEGDAGQTMSAGGITVTVPSRWGAHDEDATGPWAGIYQNKGSEGALYFSTDVPANPKEAAAKKGGETFSWSHGGREFTGEIYNWSLADEPDNYSLTLFSEFSNDVCLSVKLKLNAGNGDPQVLKDYIETDTFKNIIASMQLDESGLPVMWRSVDDSGLVRTAEGMISGYEGTDTEIVIPEMISGVTITGIGPGVFMNNQTITSVTLPETMENIGQNAFRDCANLQTVSFGGTKSIGQTAFAGCTALKDVTLPEKVSYVGPNAFLQAGSGSFTAEGAAKYADSCFSESTFETITIGDGSDLSANMIFFQAKAKEITLGENIPSLGMGCFGTTLELRRLTLPSQMESIGESCFAWTAAPFIRIPEGVSEIPEQALVTEEAVIVLPESVKKIEGLGVKGGVVMLCGTDVELADSAIDTSFLLLPGVYGKEDIGFAPDKAHVTMRRMRIAMDATVAESDAIDAFLAENGQEEVCWFGVSTELMSYQPDDFEWNNEFVAGYRGTDPEICIPLLTPGMEYVGWGIQEGAFAGTNVRSIVLHNNVYGIENGAFRGCDSLTDLWFSTDILSKTDAEAVQYADGAFAEIPASATVHIPASLTDAERGTVESFLKSKGLPDGVSFDYFSLR